MVTPHGSEKKASEGEKSFVVQEAFGPRLGLSALRSEYAHYKKFVVGSKVFLTRDLKFDSVSFPAGHRFSVTAVGVTGVDLKDDGGRVFLGLDRKFLDVVIDPAAKEAKI